MSINLKGRNLLTLQDFSATEISYLLELSAQLKSKKKSKQLGRELTGKNIALIFAKPSTRTHCAFEVAAYDEGAHVTLLTHSHLGHKESIADTAKFLGRLYDGIQYRGFAHREVELLAQYAGVPVYNGLTDQDHPTQALADLLTIKEHIKKPFNEIKVVYVGDARNNVATALLIACSKLGLHFVALAPQALQVNADFVAKINQDIKHTGSGARVEQSSDIIPAVENADVIYTDVWVSMGEEDQWEQRIQLLKPYQINTEMMKYTKNNKVIFMHCLPAFHNTDTEMGMKMKHQFGLDAMEVTDEVFNSAYSVVFDQAENRLHTIKAVLVATL